MVTVHKVTPSVCCCSPNSLLFVQEFIIFTPNLLFLSTSCITQERSNPLKHGSVIVWHVNVGVCTSYRVVGHTASSELLLHSLLGTSLSSLSPCPPRSHLLLCSVLKETKKRKGFIGQVSSLNELFLFFIIMRLQNLQIF